MPQQQRQQTEADGEVGTDHPLDSIARAHLESFGEIRPASTVVQVAALTPALALVEIEMTAVVHD